jgi:hypothetical protein
VIVTEQARRKAARVLVAVGLDQQPGNPWGMAHDVADALGLLPDTPPSNPGHGYRDAHEPAITGRPRT